MLAISPDPNSSVALCECHSALADQRRPATGAKPRREGTGCGVLQAANDRDVIQCGVTKLQRHADRSRSPEVGKIIRAE
ncbi:MAG TPA: hypothetical protein VF976_13380 [Gemmatimonadales bacterium]